MQQERKWTFSLVVDKFAHPLSIAKVEMWNRGAPSFCALHCSDARRLSSRSALLYDVSTGGKLSHPPLRIRRTLFRTRVIKGRTRDLKGHIRSGRFTKQNQRTLLYSVYAKKSKPKCFTFSRGIFSSATQSSKRASQFKKENKNQQSNYASLHDDRLFPIGGLPGTHRSRKRSTTQVR